MNTHPTEEDAEPQKSGGQPAGRRTAVTTPPPGSPLSWDDAGMLVINCALLPLMGRPPATIPDRVCDDMVISAWWRTDGCVVIDWT